MDKKQNSFNKVEKIWSDKELIETNEETASRLYEAILDKSKKEPLDSK